MFCNGPEMDGGDTAYLGPTTIIEMTIPRCQSSSAMTLDDSGGLAGPIRTDSTAWVKLFRAFLAFSFFPKEITESVESWWTTKTLIGL